MPSLDALIASLRSSWSERTSADPSEWSPERPARGQCDVTALVVRKHLGGDLVMGRVFLDGAQTEHHWWNRFGSEDVDLTKEQFTASHEIREERVITPDVFDQIGASIKPEVIERFEVLDRLVTANLDVG